MGVAMRMCDMVGVSQSVHATGGEYRSVSVLQLRCVAVRCRRYNHWVSVHVVTCRRSKAKAVAVCDEPVLAAFWSHQCSAAAYRIADA